jgi:hypothetical protein
MKYSIELQNNIKKHYKGFIPLMNALNSGSPILGRFLCDSIPNLKRPKNELMQGKELDEFIIKQVKDIWEKEDIYHNWKKEANEKN